MASKEKKAELPMERGSAGKEDAVAALRAARERVSAVHADLCEAVTEEINAYIALVGPTGGMDLEAKKRVVKRVNELCRQRGVMLAVTNPDAVKKNEPIFLPRVLVCGNLRGQGLFMLEDPETGKRERSTAALEEMGIHTLPREVDEADD